MRPLPILLALLCLVAVGCGPSEGDVYEDIRTTSRWMVENADTPTGGVLVSSTRGIRVMTVEREEFDEYYRRVD